MAGYQPDAVLQARLSRRFGAGEERLREIARAAGRRELAGVAVDLDEGDALGGLERHVRPAGERALHEARSRWAAPPASR